MNNPSKILKIEIQRSLGLDTDDSSKIESDHSVVIILNDVNIMKKLAV